VALSLLVLGAHFLRAGNPGLLLVVLVLLAFLAVPRHWAARTVQVALLLGALEWLRTLVQRAGERMTFGQPYARLVVILGAVAAVTALSALAFRAAAVRRRFRLDEH
jgi:phosphate/sulfate permease